MNSKDAFFLLFVNDFGKGPLFKNQVDLVNQLLNTPLSEYYTSKDDPDYPKAVSRLKAYISQLFSGSSKRTITNEFKESLHLLLQTKSAQFNFNPSEILENVLWDLREKTQAPKNLSLTGRKDIEEFSSLFKNILEANYISIFTAREISIDLYLSNRRIPIIDFLIDDFINSLAFRHRFKKYRFNFPLEQTCNLFWRGLKKEIARHLQEKPHALSFIMPILISNNILDINKSELQGFSYLHVEQSNEIENAIVPALLNWLSKNGVINVFHLKVPIYVTSSITINPNDPINCSTYLFLQSSSGEDVPHKLSDQEMLLWKFFVWDNLKINTQGKQIEFKDTPRTM